MTDKKRYRCKVGLNYGPDGSIRREPGEIADDIPPRSVGWLLEQGLIEVAEDDVPRGNHVTGGEA